MRNGSFTSVFFIFLNIENMNSLITPLLYSQAMRWLVLPKEEIIRINKNNNIKINFCYHLSSVH